MYIYFSCMAEMLSQASGDHFNTDNADVAVVSLVVRGKSALSLRAVLSCECSVPKEDRAPSISALWRHTQTIHTHLYTKLSSQGMPSVPDWLGKGANINLCYFSQPAFL